jgi:hypothetical protein
MRCRRKRFEITWLFEDFNFHVGSSNFDPYRVTRMFNITFPCHSKLELYLQVQGSHKNFMGKIHPTL